jgi:RimJ/RimL family protein N-acetyltransferase
MKTPAYTSFIEGQNIYLREVRDSDVNERYYAWMNDHEITQYLETRFYPNSVATIAAFVKSRDGDPNNVFLAIVQKSTDQHIGNVKVGPINWIHRTAEIGILLGEKKDWGKGFAAETLDLVSHYAFDKLNLRKLTAGCYGNNKGSEKAFIKAGFVVEGVRKSHFFCNGEYVDYVLLGLFNKRFNISTNDR